MILISANDLFCFFIIVSPTAKSHKCCTTLIQLVRSLERRAAHTWLQKLISAVQGSASRSRLALPKAASISGTEFPFDNCFGISGSGTCACLLGCMTPKEASKPGATFLCWAIAQSSNFSTKWSFACNFFSMFCISDIHASISESETLICGGTDDLERPGINLL